HRDPVGGSPARDGDRRLAGEIEDPGDARPLARLADHLRFLDCPRTRGHRRHREHVDPFESGVGRAGARLDQQAHRPRVHVGAHVARGFKTRADEWPVLGGTSREGRVVIGARLDREHLRRRPRVIRGVRPAHLAHLRAARGEGLDRQPHQGRDLAIALVPDPLLWNPDPQAPRAGIDPGEEVGDRPIGRGGIARIVSGRRGEDDRDVPRTARERTWVIQRPRERDRADQARPAVTGLETDAPAERGGDARERGFGQRDRRHAPRAHELGGLLDRELGNLFDHARIVGKGRTAMSDRSFVRAGGIAGILLAVASWAAVVEYFLLVPPAQQAPLAGALDANLFLASLATTTTGLVLFNGLYALVAFLALVATIAAYQRLRVY